MKKIFYVFIMAVSFFVLNSCTTDIFVSLESNGNVYIEFYGEAGANIMELLNEGNQSIKAEEGVIKFDPKVIKDGLTKSGFSNVLVTSQKGNDIFIKMTDKEKKSEYFSSGLLKVENKKIKVLLSPDTLKKFYETSDEETKSYLDMLLSPVFNDDSMTEKEYLETLSSFYGKDVAKEIQDCDISVKIKNPDGKEKKHTIKLTKILTLNESFQLE